MREAWRELMFADEDQQAKQTRDPVSSELTRLFRGVLGLKRQGARVRLQELLEHQPE